MQEIAHSERVARSGAMSTRRNLEQSSVERAASIVLHVLPWLWLGIVVGISVIETPLRFRTPPITRAGAAMLGVAVFHALTYVELVLLVLVMAAALLLRRRWQMLAAAMLGVVVAVEHGILLPLLSVRAQLLVQGATLEPSSVHAWATACEAGKMVLLTLLGILGLRR